jgi:Predicted pPIWI-associating nuclease
MLGELLERLIALQGVVRRGKSVNLNDRQTKEALIALTTSYFSEYRDQITSTIGEAEGLPSLDEEWQNLLRLLQGNSSRKTYAKVLKTLRKKLSELNVACLSRVSAKGISGTSLSDLTEAEELIIATLESYVPSAAASYRQGILDLQAHSRLSYRGTVSEFREALRETLDHLSPDEEVMQQQGFRLEQGQTKPTMRQKVRYVLKSRGRKKTQTESAEKSADLVESLASEIARAVYNRASLATHVESARIEVQRVKRYVDTVLFDLLEIGAVPSTGEDT